MFFFFFEQKNECKIPSYHKKEIKIYSGDKVDAYSTVCTGEIKMAVSFFVEKSKEQKNEHTHTPCSVLKVELCQQFYVFVICKLFYALAFFVVVVSAVVP